MSETKADNAIDVWWCDPFNRIKNEDYLPYFACSFNHGYQNLHGMIYAGLDKLCKELNFEPAFDSPYDLIFDEDIFKQPFNFSFDFLVVNSDFFSNQLILTETQKDLVFEDLIEQIVNNGKTFITTKKIANYPCTLDTNLSLVNIGQLAKNCKTIIAIATAPFVSVLNKYSLESCEHFINFTHDWNSLGDFEKLINIESVENLFSLVENL
jgi:hypothetical protein